MDKNQIKVLAKVLKLNDCVLFIGSGISMWSNLPSWSGLISELIDFMKNNGLNVTLVKRELENGELLQAASYGLDKLSQEQKIDFFRRVCRVESANPSEIHKKIVQLEVPNFITTNYDRLIEKSLYKWCSNACFNVVTNKQLAEMGMLQNSRSSNFVFKPHGDIGDIDSIILTREQYRSLLEGGERHQTLEVLKHLMVSRPIVYLGFGLRDPDFMYLRDILSNIYQGNVRDHYAIMADVEKDEVEYWKKNYGIQIIGYKTQVDAQGKKTHDELLELLESIKNELEENTEQVISSAEQTLAIIRYASNFDRFIKVNPEFGLRVHPRRYALENKKIDYRYYGCIVDELLKSCEQNIILLGVPGAGKSYSMQRAANYFAKQLKEECIKEKVNLINLTIPIYIDLKQYNGDLYVMIEENFSKMISVNMLLTNCKCKLFLDSFNEMPKEYWENAKYKKDFEKTLKKIRNVSVVIGSRSMDGLTDWNYEQYLLDEIDGKTIKEEILKLGYNKELSRDLYQIVNKPFNFKYIVNKEVDINQMLSPDDFYKLLFDKLEKEFNEKFGQIDFYELLTEAAYNVMDAGNETFSAVVFTDILKRNGKNEILDEILNWMIYKQLLTVRSNGKLAFIHQSITEFLASSKLLKEYKNDHEILKEKCKNYRWDQTICFVLSISSKEIQKELIETLFEIDFGLVLGCVPYIHVNKEWVSKKCLEYILEKDIVRKKNGWRICRFLTDDMPVSESLEKDVQKIALLRNSIGGAAVKYLYKLKGPQYKNELLTLFWENYTDYNFINNYVAKILEELVDENDYEELCEIITRLEEKEDEDLDGSMASILVNLDENFVENLIVNVKDNKSISRFRKNVLSEYCYCKQTNKCFEMALRYLLNGWAEEIMFAIDCLIKSGGEDIDFSIVNKKHIDCMLEKIHDVKWTVDALTLLLERRNEYKDYVEEQIKKLNEVDAISLQYCISPNSNKFFSLFNYLVDNKEEESIVYGVGNIRGHKIVWNSHQELFEKIVEKGYLKVLDILLGSSVPVKVEGINNIAIGEVEVWLDRMLYILNNDHEEGLWKVHKLANFLCNYTTDEFKEKILSIFNERNVKYCKLIYQFLLDYFEFSIYDLSKEAIEYIYDDLKVRLWTDVWNAHFLYKIVDEEYINKVMIEMYNSAEGILKENLFNIIEMAGRSHGKRYIL